MDIMYDASLYGITRVDNAAKRQYGWQVTIERRRIRYQRFFPDVLCRGRQRALRSAMQFRDKIAIEPLLSRKDYGAILRKNNNSGEPGVCRTVITGRNGTQAAYWLAFWPKGGGKSSRAKFSIAKYGEDLAFQLALKARQDALMQLEGPHITYAPQRQWQERFHSRYPTSVAVTLVHGNEVCPAIMRDISQGGCCVEMKNSPAENARIEIALADGLRVDGRVVWVCGARAGIQFDHLLEELDVQRLSRLKDLDRKADRALESLGAY